MSAVCFKNNSVHNINSLHVCKTYWTQWVLKRNEDPVLGGYRMEGNLGGDGERTVSNKIQYMKLSELIKEHFKKSTLYFLLLSGNTIIRFKFYPNYMGLFGKSTFKKVLAVRKPPLAMFSPE